MPPLFAADAALAEGGGGTFISCLFDSSSSVAMLLLLLLLLLARAVVVVGSSSGSAAGTLFLITKPLGLGPPPPLALVEPRERDDRDAHAHRRPRLLRAHRVRHHLRAVVGQVAVDLEAERARPARRLILLGPGEAGEAEVPPRRPGGAHRAARPRTTPARQPARRRSGRGG